ncbi:MAG: chorismate synthase [Clostridia bacterium]|nr:chorismate synthase [Clostridia bacterium]
MKNTFGNALKVTLFGESHGEMIGAVIDGLTPGIEIDNAFIDSQLERRRSKATVCTQRKEKDEYRIVSGVLNGYTTGTPLCILIPNLDTKSSDYQLFDAVARPGHADYTANCKYHGYQDHRGGGHFSGRVTVALVAAGAIVQSALAKKNIRIGTHIKKCGSVYDRDFCDYVKDIEYIQSIPFSILDKDAEKQMMDLMIDAKKQNDSIGGVMETAVVGMPAGVGEPWFDTLESMLSHAMFAIPAIKGVEFGAGFACADMLGSEMNDEFYIEDGKILTRSNNNGGINGGISNGMPIVFRCAIKPASSIPKKQKTVNFKEMTETEVEIAGRHDSAIIPRACVVTETVAALVIADALLSRFGTDYLLN